VQPLRQCARCGSFVPPSASACPHCDASLRVSRKGRALVGGLLAVVGGGALAITLAACYGPPCPAGGCGTGRCDDPTTDTDGDGYCGAYDCDETRADVHADAYDPPGDGIDQNCDGVDGIVDAGP
jgi:hypothetical protein